MLHVKVAVIVMLLSLALATASCSIDVPAVRSITVSRTEWTYCANGCQLAFSELEAYGAAGNPTNLALSGKATQSSLPYPESGPENCIDGDHRDGSVTGAKVCTTSYNDKNSHWNLTWSTDQCLERVVLYRNDDGYATGAIITLHNATGGTVGPSLGPLGTVPSTKEEMCSEGVCITSSLWSGASSSRHSIRLALILVSALVILG